LLHACSGSLVWCAFHLAAAAYLNLHYVTFLLPFALLLAERRKSGWALVILFAALSLAFQGLSLFLVGEQKYLSVLLATHGSTFVIREIPPSLSTLWYLGMELFDRFSVYFTILLAATPYLLIVPLWIRLYRYAESLVRF
jgi:hypothetical protein